MRPAWCPPEHACGTLPAYEAGCPGDGCRLMMLLHTRGSEARVIAEETTRRIGAEPYGLILRELLAAGWTFPKLAARTGYSAPALRNIALGITRWIFPDTARALRSLLDLLPSEAAS